jgi:hypothetical protein
MQVCIVIARVAFYPSMYLQVHGVLKLLRSPGIDSKELVPPAYGAWRTGLATLFLLDSCSHVLF